MRSYRIFKFSTQVQGRVPPGLDPEAVHDTFTYYYIISEEMRRTEARNENDDDSAEDEERLIAPHDGQAVTTQ